jgi:hypothetical protein
MSRRTAMVAPCLIFVAGILPTAARFVGRLGRGPGLSERRGAVQRPPATLSLAPVV